MLIHDGADTQRQRGADDPGHSNGTQLPLPQCPSRGMEKTKESVGKASKELHPTGKEPMRGILYYTLTLPGPSTFLFSEDSGHALDMPQEKQTEAAVPAEADPIIDPDTELSLEPKPLRGIQTSYC